MIRIAIHQTSHLNTTHIFFDVISVETVERPQIAHAVNMERMERAKLEQPKQDNLVFCCTLHQKVLDISLRLSTTSYSFKNSF